MRESIYVLVWEEGDPCPKCGSKMIVNQNQYDHHGHDSTSTVVDCKKCEVRIHPVMFIRK